MAFQNILLIQVLITYRICPHILHVCGILVTLLPGFLQDQILHILPFLLIFPEVAWYPMEGYLCLIMRLFTLEIYVWDFSKL